MKIIKLEWDEMDTYEFEQLCQKIEEGTIDDRTLEVRSAEAKYPENLYETFSSFSNQDDGGIILFGFDEREHDKKTGVYDAEDLKKRLLATGEGMTPSVRPILTVFQIDGKSFVTAEIIPLDIAERPCFKTVKGRLKGAFIREKGKDRPICAYEIYSYDAYREKVREDIRTLDEISYDLLDANATEGYFLLRKKNYPKFSVMPKDELLELTGITRNHKVTLAAALLFSKYPQAYFPQLSILASVVSGTEIGALSEEGQRFSDKKRIEGTLPEMLEEAIRFVKNNMGTAVKRNPHTGMREDRPEYPLEAVREAILNALVQRDYSIHTEHMPIQLLLFSERLEVRNPGGLYGRTGVDQLGHMQADTRNPMLVTMMEALGKTENRRSGIPRIRQAMKKYHLPEPEFHDLRHEFVVCLYKDSGTN